MALKPWYKVVTPREDLREGRPMDASEFAVHLDQVRDGRAPEDYQEPKRFFERTYMTQNLTSVAAEVIRRLSGIKTETSSVFNMTTPFGGGKTHALTLLYHLAKHGKKADSWVGIKSILDKAGVSSVPSADMAVFVGTEFDSLTGRGGDDGTPLRKTPWGEIAFQIGGTTGFKVVAEHEKEMIAPSGEVIRKFLPKNKPCLILMDELINYTSRFRKIGMGDQLYSFLQTLSEEVRGHDNVVLAVSIPASELEMGVEDQSDYSRYKKLLDRLGKAVALSVEGETSEIIRRRLFEWHGLPDDGKKTISEYAAWVVEHRQQIPGWFPTDHARDAFADSYPFHPTVLSVFERKWQSLNSFQRTRGVLRMLALWVSRAFVEGFKGAHKDPLIGLGTAPLDDPIFRAALFEQLGEQKLDGAVTTDICGKKDAHAFRLDQEASDIIKKSRLHRKVCTTIFFESNGGQTKTEATRPEINLSVGEPDLDIGNIDNVLEALSGSCYYLSVEGNHYRFSLSPNLNKLLADRRANIQSQRIEERVRSEIQTVFSKGSGIERSYFPKKSGDIPDRAALTFVILDPDNNMQDKSNTDILIESMTKEHGTSSRSFKSALIWCVPDSAGAMQEEARKALAWEDIKDEQSELGLDEGHKKQLEENLKKAKRDLHESVWRAYRYIKLLDKNNQIRTIDFGPVHSSEGESLINIILNRLTKDDEVTKDYSPRKLANNWPPAIQEWSTQAVRDMFFASPKFPRLLDPLAIKDTIARGVSEGILAYVGKTAAGDYKPFYFNDTLNPFDVEISDEMYIVTAERAKEYAKKGKVPDSVVKPPTLPDITTPKPKSKDEDIPNGKSISCVRWNGKIAPQKWTNFYMKVLTRFATREGLNLNVSVEFAPEGGLSEHEIEEMKMALRELGLEDDVEI